MAVTPHETQKVKRLNMVATLPSSPARKTTSKFPRRPFLVTAPGSRKSSMAQNDTTYTVMTIKRPLKTNLNLFSWSSWLNSIGWIKLDEEDRKKERLLSP